MPKRLVVEIVGDASQLQKAFGQSEKAAGGFGKSMGGLAKAAAVAGTAIIAGLGLAAKIGFDELQQGERVSAQTAAALKSTGEAANVTAEQIEGLAGALSRKSSVDDEAIQSGQNLLLTFTNVRNEVGRGNDVFNQATATMLDMSVALGQDMSSSAIQLGKALNDPLNGLTALQRVGVTFTAAQKEQIAAMVESGNVMGAQKVILAELNKEFGGSAEALGGTLTGSINKAKNAFSEMAASLVAALLPAITTLAEKVATASAYLTEHQGAAKTLVIGLVALAAGLVAVKVGMAAYTVATAAAAVATVGLGESATLADKLIGQPCLWSCSFFEN